VNLVTVHPLSTISGAGHESGEKNYRRVADKFFRILEILCARCRNVRALPFLVWSGPALLVIISVLAAYENWSLPRIKSWWLEAEYFVLLPVLVLNFAGGYRRERALFEVKPTPSPRRRKWLPIALFLVCLVPLAFTLDRGTYQGDENAYLFQARCPHAGALYTSQPARLPVKAITYDHHVILNGK